MNVYFVYKVLTNRIRALIIAVGYFIPGPLPLFRTASDGKLGGAWERGYTGTSKLSSKFHHSKKYLGPAQTDTTTAQVGYITTVQCICFSKYKCFKA